jgi:death-on-curing protein
VIFLGLNGFGFDAPEDEVVEKMVSLASGELAEEGLADWIRSRSRPLP